MKIKAKQTEWVAIMRKDLAIAMLEISDNIKKILISIGSMNIVYHGKGF
jgi:hypothetical protein